MKLIAIVSFVISLLTSTHLMASDAQRGAKLFKLCVACHGNDALGRKDLAAPAIAGMQEWYLLTQMNHFRNGARGKHPMDDAGMRMRPMARTLNNDDDIKAVVAYVAKLPAPKATTKVMPRGEGQPLHGKKTYETVCMACHGAEAQGNESLKAPSLAHADDWYLLTQLKNFKARVRGSDPALDPSGATMAPMAMGLNEQAMKDVVSYIQTLR